MNYLIELPNGYRCLIDGRNFLRTKLASKDVCRLQAESHVRCLLQNQDGGLPQQRTLGERRNLYQAMATP